MLQENGGEGQWEEVQEGPQEEADQLHRAAPEAYLICQHWQGHGGGGGAHGGGCEDHAQEVHQGYPVLRYHGLLQLLDS